MTRTARIPVFPLGTVLFPDGVLPLRIFEPRYMDMVRDCLKNDTEFGVCLITEGSETGTPAAHEPIGCSARIVHWDMEQLGLLNIRTVGVCRFEVTSDELQPDGLRLASVNFIEPETDQPIPDQYLPCVRLLEQVVDDLNGQISDPVQQPVKQPFAFESATWVSNRLCEVLPISAQDKHCMMSLCDPIARLKIIHEFLNRQQVI